MMATLAKGSLGSPTSSTSTRICALEVQGSGPEPAEGCPS